MPALLTSSRAHDRRAAAQDWLRQRRDGPVWVVGPSLAAAGELCRGALDRGAVLGWHRETLDTLARSLAAPELARRGWVLATPVALQAAMHHALASRRGQLGPLESLVDLPGTPRAALATVSELRLAGLSAEQVPARMRPLFTAYDDALQQLALADRAVLLRCAAEAAEPLTALLFDVLPRWPAERELVRRLTHDDTFATAPAGASTAVRHLASALGVLPQSLPQPSTTSLERTQHYLFAARSPAPLQLDSTVQLLSAPGEYRECVELARAVHAQAERGVPLDEMAIVLRQPTRYLPHLADALERAGLPAHFTDGLTRPEPSGRALLALLACRRDHLSARSLCRFLALGECKTHRGGIPRRWEALLARAGAETGRYAERLDALADELLDEPESEGRSRRLEELARLRETLLPLVARLDTLPERASWRAWLEQLRDLAQTTLRRPDEVLTALDPLAALGELGPVSVDQVLRVLEEHLGELRVPPEPRRYGQLWVGSTDQVAGHSFRVVLLPGLAERQFPLPLREDPLLLDRDRASAPELDTQAERADSERRALYLATGAASERLIVSWPRLDAATGRPHVPSFYILELLRAATGRIPRVRAIEERAAAAAAASVAWPAPPNPEQAVDDTEYDLALLGPVVRHRQAGQAGLAAYLLDANPHLARALRARARRWTVRKQTPADGLVQPRAPVAALLDSYRPSQRATSATQLERAARCPYQYALHSLLGLRPAAELVPIERVDASTRGELLHRAIAALVDRGTALHDDDARDQLDACLDEAADTLRARTAPAVPRVWDDAVASLRADLHGWLDDVRRSGFVPVAAERAFGEEEPLRVAGALLRGRMDLVERAHDGALRVTDLKTGSPPERDRFVTHGGEVLQPLLYALALHATAPERTVLSGRLHYATRRERYEERDIPLTDRTADTVTRAVGHIDALVQRGELAAHPVRGACSRCDFREVCGPHEARRTSIKPAPDPLRLLRELP